MGGGVRAFPKGAKIIVIIEVLSHGGHMSHCVVLYCLVLYRFLYVERQPLASVPNLEIQGSAELEPAPLGPWRRTR